MYVYAAYPPWHGSSFFTQNKPGTMILLESVVSMIKKMGFNDILSANLYNVAGRQAIFAGNMLSHAAVCPAAQVVMVVCIASDAAFNVFNVLSYAENESAGTGRASVGNS